MFTKALIFVLLGSTLMLANPVSGAEKGGIFKDLKEQFKKLAKNAPESNILKQAEFQQKYKEHVEEVKKALEQKWKEWEIKLEEAKKEGKEQYQKVKEQSEKAMKEELAKSKAEIEKLKNQVQKDFQAVKVKIN